MDYSIVQPIVITAVSIVCILLIISDNQTNFEEKLTRQYGITRVWYVPAILVSVLVLFSVIDTQTVVSVFSRKIDIIVLILSFAILSEGMRSSGVFAYLASYVSKGAQSSYQLLLYICVGTSIVTIFTSNDIVVIALTPVITQICVQSGLRNLRLILLSQFVIANTLSMATYIGSPTNIILSEELDINFLQYIEQMAGPSIVAFLTTMTVISVISKIAQRNDGYLNEFEMEKTLRGTYQPKETGFSLAMMFWILLFVFSVGLVAVLTLRDMTLLWCAIPLVIVSLVSIQTLAESSSQNSLYKLPYGILFFGLSFFVIGESLVSTSAIQLQVVPTIQRLVETNTSLSITLSVFVTGVVVNVFNDLPAATIVSPIVGQLVFQSEAQKAVFTKAVLVGLNIGKYVTQAGALAGIAWFNQINREVAETNTDITVPTKTDLLSFGIINFVITGLVLSLYLMLEYVVLQSL